MSYTEMERLRPTLFAARGRNKYDFVYPGGEGYATMATAASRYQASPSGMGKAPGRMGIRGPESKVPPEISTASRLAASSH